MESFNASDRHSRNIYLGTGDSPTGPDAVGMATVSAVVSQCAQSNTTPKSPPSGETIHYAHESDTRTEIGTCSATPNARASRLFRERRKEREKVLRETIAELADRNAALETLLLHHGIAPPVSATLQNDLSLNRSKHLGGPPIHIPGLTSVRPPLNPRVTEQSNLHGSSPIEASRFQGFCRPLLPPVPSSDLFACGRLHDPCVHQHSELTRFPDRSLEAQSASLHTLTNASPPVQAFGDMLRVRTGAISPSHHGPVSGQRHPDCVQKLPPPNLNPSSMNAPQSSLSVGSNLQGTGQSFPQFVATAVPGLTSPSVATHAEAYRHAESMAPHLQNAMLTHPVTPPDSGLLARMPVLSSAEERVIASRSGSALHHLWQPSMFRQDRAEHETFALDGQPLQPQLQNVEMQLPRMDTHIYLQNSRLTTPGLSMPLKACPKMGVSGPNVTRDMLVPLIQPHVFDPVMLAPSRPRLAGQRTGFQSDSGLESCEVAYGASRTEAQQQSRSGSASASRASARAWTHPTASPSSSRQSVCLPSQATESTSDRSTAFSEPTYNQYAGRSYVAHSVLEGIFDEHYQDTHDSGSEIGTSSIRRRNTSESIRSGTAASRSSNQFSDTISDSTFGRSSMRSSI